MERQVHARAEAEWQQALDLEKKLRACSRKRSFYDAEVRGLRKQLRDTYESLLFLDAAFAAANDVEGQMWRTVFYMPIEEFRTRIRKAEKEVQQQKAGAAPVGGPDAATILAKTAAAFLKFLDEAALFYKRLVMQLQSAYGDVKVRLELPPGVPVVRSMGAAADGVDGMQISTGSSIARDMRASIHRCLVFLGDLSRYASQAAPKAATVTAVTAAGSSAAANTAAKAEWSKAVGYYRMAAHVLPRSGNPHNQLAVMAFMTGEELKAAYHYARSLCVHVPFMTARENLLQLLQNNRDRYDNLCKQRQLQQVPAGQGRPVLPMQQQLSELSTCYVRLAGLLYDRINQHEYPHVAKAAFESLAGFLDHPQLLALLQRQRQYDCTPLHMVVLSIFMVHHSFGGVGAGGAQSGRQHEQPEQAANGAHSRPATAEASAAAAAAALNGSAGRDSSTGGLKTYVGAPSPLSPIAAAPVGTYGDTAQRSVQRGRALAMLFRTGRLLAQAATAAVNAEAAAAVAGGACNGMAAAAAAGKTGATNLLVGLNVVLQWLAAQPNCAVLQAATGTEEDAKARSKFWTAVGQLLLVLAPALNLYYEQQRQQQQHGAATAGSNGAAAAAAVPGSASAGGASGSMGADASCEEGALPEDLELLGFEPMRSRHYWHVTDVGKHAVDETRTRIKRMLAAARVTSAALAADQQAQLAARHLSGNISAQALNQLGMAVQQFIEVVALVAASKTPSASPKVPAAAVCQPGTMRPQQQQHGPTAMDIDGRAGDAAGQPEHQQHQQQQGRGSAAAAAAAADAEECEEEEVIVFRPRISRLSSPALDDALAAAAAAASPAAQKATAAVATAAGQGSSGPGSQVQGGGGAAAAGTPPLPQTLLAGRQPGSATASPTIWSAEQQQQQQQLRTAAEQLAHAAEVAAAAGQSGGSGDVGRPTATLNAAAGGGRGSQQGPPPAAAAAAEPVSAGMLLQGHAATALDLQQAQAASDMLLARLTARQGASSTAAAAAPGFGGSGHSSMLAAQQQGPVAVQGGGASLANGFGGLGAMSAGFAAPGFTHISAGFPAGGDLQQQAGFGDDIAMEQALIGTGLATLLGGLGDAFMGPSAAAADGGGGGGGGAASMYDSAPGSSAVGFSGLQGLQAGNDALAAVSAAVAASMQAAGLQAPSGAQFGGQLGKGVVAGVSGGFPAVSAAAAASIGMNLGLSDPLAALGMLGIPADALGLSVGIPGSRAGGQGFGNQLPQGFGAFGDDPGGPMRTVSASAATGGAYGGLAGVGVGAGGRKVSAPVGILQQAAADAAADAAQQQQQLSSSYVANHQMEATALDAANRVLSPDMHDSGAGLELLQQHQRQQQQQQQLGGLMPSAMPAGGEVGAMRAALPAVPSHGGSWMSGSTGSTPRATTPRGGGGLSAAFQQQQQQMQAQRRLSAGSASPRSAIGADRGSTPVGSNGLFGGTGVPGADQGVAGGAASRAGRMSVPSFSMSAAAAGGSDLQQQRQQRSSIGAMFAGPDLFAPSEQLPPMHRRASSGSGVAAAAAGGSGVAVPTAGGFDGSGSRAADAAGISLFAGGTVNGDRVGDGMQDEVSGEGGLLPSFFEDVLQQPVIAAAAGDVGPVPTILQRQPLQQQQQQLRVVAESPDQGDGGLTLVEYLAAQQRKLQQQGTWVNDHSSNGLQAAAATGADLSAHVLLPPLDFAESQNPFG